MDSHGYPSIRIASPPSFANSRQNVKTISLDFHKVSRLRHIGVYEKTLQATDFNLLFIFRFFWRWLAHRVQPLGAKNVLTTIDPKI